jgi:vacuolar protein sorting-associated protein 53
MMAEKPKWLNERLEAVLLDDLTSTDAFDDRHFNSSEYINRVLFPTEQSLSLMDAQAKKLKRRIRQFDAECSQRIRQEALRVDHQHQLQQQYQDDNKEEEKKQVLAKQNSIQDAKRTIAELYTKIAEIRQRAVHTERMVNEICANIKQLDYAKRNLMVVGQCLKTMQMMSTTVEQLRQHAARKRYRSVADLLNSSRQFAQQLHGYETLPKVRDMLADVDGVCSQLATSVYKVFGAAGVERRNSIDVVAAGADKRKKLADNVAVAAADIDNALRSDTEIEALRDVCLLVDALGDKQRRDFQEWFCERRLDDYRRTFALDEHARLAHTDRRYTWMARELRFYASDWHGIFPAAWRMDEVLVEEFCFCTAEDLYRRLENAQTDETLDVKTLVAALQWTLDFERQLCQQFPAPEVALADVDLFIDDDQDQDDDERDGAIAASSSSVATRNKKSADAKQSFQDPNSVEAIRYRWKRRLREQRREAMRVAREAISGGNTSSNSDARDKGRRRSADADDADLEHATVQLPSRFESILSSCFDPFMIVYTTQLDELMSEKFAEIVGNETWQIDQDDRNKVLASAQDVILVLRKTQESCLRLTKHQALFDLHRLYKKHLQAYAKALLARLAIDERQIATPSAELTILLIANSAEYMRGQIDKIVLSLKQNIDRAFADAIDMKAEQGAFADVVAHAVKTLARALECALAPALADMAALDWSRWHSVGDQNDYVTRVCQHLERKIPLYKSWLKPVHFRFFHDSFVGSFIPALITNIYACRRIVEVGAEQMLLDVQSLKAKLIELPTLGDADGGTVNRRYVKFVQRELDKAEMLLKVLITPFHPPSSRERVSPQLVDSYNALIVDRSAANFQRVLQLKGIESPHSDALLDIFCSRLPDDHRDRQAAADASNGTAADQSNAADESTTASSIVANASSIFASFSLSSNDPSDGSDTPSSGGAAAASSPNRNNVPSLDRASSIFDFLSDSFSFGNKE